MRYLILFILFTSSLYSIPIIHEGTIDNNALNCQEFTQHRNIRKICMKNIEVKYKLSTLVGEPTHLYKVKWQSHSLITLSNGQILFINSLSAPVQDSFKKINIIYPTYFKAGLFKNHINIFGRNYYGHLIFNGDIIGKSGKEGFSLTGSPNWNKFIAKDKNTCNTKKEEFTFLDKKNAKAIMKTTFKVDNLEVCSLTFGGIHQLDIALDKDCSWRTGKEKELCLKKEEKKKKEKKLADKFENELDSIEEKKTTSNDDFDSIEDENSKTSDDFDSIETANSSSGSFDDLDTLEKQESKIKLRNAFNKKARPVEIKRDNHISRCSDDKPTKPKDKFWCSMRKYQTPISLVGSFYSKLSKYEKKIYHKKRDEEDSRRARAYNQERDRVCDPEKDAWIYEKSTYKDRLSSWNKTKSQCIKNAHSIFKSDVNKIKAHEKEMENLENEMTF